MHGTNNIKFATAKQAKELYCYQNIKTKLHETNAAIWYNKMYRQLQLSPAYVNIMGKIIMI
jgi:hypothetical protein